VLNKFNVMTNREMVMSFYEGALTVNANTNPEAALNAILASDFLSVGTVENKSKEQLIGQLNFFWKMIPNLVWQPVEVLEVGNQIVVRSTITGTPNSPEGGFFGLPTDGTKSFSTMSIDIHTIVDGKISTVNHIEDWSTAMKQLKS